MNLQTVSSSRVIGICAMLALALASPLVSAGPNLIKNADAESGPGSKSGGELEPIPFWTNVNDGPFTVVQYNDSNGGPSTTSPGPANRGANYFAGGPNNAESMATQLIDLSFAASAIASGSVGFTLSGWLGGYLSQNDHARLSATWIDFDGATGNAVTLDSIFAAERDSTTGLIFRTLSGYVPSTARSVLITLDMIRTDGSYNDASADNLSFSTGEIAGPTAPVPEPSTCALMLGGLALVARLARRRSPHFQPGDYVGALINPVQPTLGPGTYTITNASNLEGADPYYSAWRFNGGQNWVWAFEMIDDATKKMLVQGCCGDVYGTQAGAASASFATTYSSTFTLAATTTLDFITEDYYPYDNYGGIALNIQSVTAAVPEPQTYALLLGGLLAMSRFARRRRG